MQEREWNDTSDLETLTWWPHSMLEIISVNLTELGSMKGDYNPWVCTVVASLLVGFAGIVPLIFIPIHATKDEVRNSNSLKLALSFGVGSLLADVFFHLLPEAWEAAIQGGLSPPEAFHNVGQYTLAGIFLFIIVEMLASHTSTNKVKIKQGIDIIGYLNLAANCIDNFAHGLSVAGSFLVSYKTGVLTTLAILIHEIPHEIGDFAILLKSGFTRFDAARAQIYTAGVGLIGALFTLFIGTNHLLNGIQVYILGFTGGAFLNIALVSVLPDLLKDDGLPQSLAQLSVMCVGIATMTQIAQFC